jgi:hypothetical protein
MSIACAFTVKTGSNVIVGSMSHRPAEDYEIRDGLGRLIEPTMTFDPVLTVNAQAIDISDRHHKFFISLRVGVGG